MSTVLEASDGLTDSSSIVSEEVSAGLSCQFDFRCQFGDGSVEFSLFIIM